MPMVSIHQGDKVVVLEKPDGTPSNIAVVIEGSHKGSIIHKQDGPPNCDLRLLSFILSGSEDTYKTYKEAFNTGVTEIQ